MHTEMQMQVIMHATICLCRASQTAKSRTNRLHIYLKPLESCRNSRGIPSRGRKYQKAFSGMRPRAESNRRVFTRSFGAQF